MKRRRALLSVIVPLIWVSSVYAQAPEYQVKAAMLYNFALFVEWPPARFASPKSPFLACVLGTDPFGPWLKYELRRADIGTHPIQIRILKNAREARNCHLLFISRSEEKNLQTVMTELQGAAALIVSDVSNVRGFCREGGMIGLIMQGGKVRFELNGKAADSAGLKISSKLGRVAKNTKCGEDDS